MSRVANLLGYAYRPPGWVVIEETAGGVVIRDPDNSLWQSIITGWRLLGTVALNAGLAVFCFLGPPRLIFQVIGWFAVLLVVLCVYCIWQRWRTPCMVRIGNGRVFLQRRNGAQVEEYDWDAREVTDIETSFGSSTFHSSYSIRIHLRDGEKVPFLHCVNSQEGHWLLNLIKMLIADEQGALMVQEGLAPALQVSLPPPPLPAMGARVAQLEEQVVRTAPPGRPDSRSGSISNQNKV